jgi:RNA polymerase sigma-70 factor (ECF subfamily)
MALTRSNDRTEAFLALLRPWQRSLEVYCRRMLRDPSQVEDVLQSAVMEAFARFDRYAAGSNFRAWVFRIVTLEVFNRNRKRGPVLWGESPMDVPDVAPGGLPVPDDALEVLPDDPDGVLEHFDDQVVEALRQLAAPERAVLLLRAVGEFSYQEIHELLAIPLGSVMGYLSRARQKLRRSLADYAAQRGLFRRSPLPGDPRP